MMLLANAITYQFSETVFLMLGAPLLLWLYWKLARYREETSKQFVGDNLGPALALKRSAFYSAWRAGLLALSWLLATIALMGPLWQQVNVLPTQTAAVTPSTALSGVAGQILRKPHDVIFALDVSASMTTTDTPTGQTRLDYARDLISDTIQRISAENVGLYLFTSDIKDLVPPTLDHLYLRMELQSIAVNATGIVGTDFRRVMGDFFKRFWSQPSDKLTTLVVFSDGGDTTLEGLPSDRRDGYIKVILREMGDVNAARRRIVTVGIGSATGQNIPGLDYQSGPVHSALLASLLEQVARSGNGVYLQASDFEGPGLSEELSTRIGEGAPSSTQGADGQPTFSATTVTVPPPVPLHVLPLVAAIALLVAALWLPEAEEDA